MKNKKGISLIVLVITIIVIIILAAAVLLSINNNNPVQNARDAVDESDTQEIQSAVTLYLGTIMADIQQSVKIVPGDNNMTEATITTKDGNNIKKSGDKFEVVKEEEETALKFDAGELGVNKDLTEYKISDKGQVTADGKKATE